MNARPSILLTACLVGMCALNCDCDRKGASSKVSARKGTEQAAGSDSSGVQRRPATRKFAKGDFEALATTIAPRLPKGWTITAFDDRVVIERAEIVEVYNGISLPRFRSEEEKREYVRPNVRKQKFTIILRLGESMSQKLHDQIEKGNSEAITDARKKTGNGKLMPDEKFWREHPEYGYREAPAFDAGDKSIYMKCDTLGGPWVFWVEEVGVECWGVVDDLGKVFRKY